MPVVLVHGRHPGPTLWIQAGLHGDEYDGVVALLKWCEHVNPDALSGSVIAVPVVNVPAFTHGTASSPLDNRNLNRTFPGNDRGTWSERFAAWVLGIIEQYARAFLDLHGGGRYLDVDHFVFYGAADAAGRNSSLDLAAATGARYLCPQPAVHEGALYAVLAARGIPAVLVEAGGGPSWRPEAVECHLTAIRGALRAVKMVDDPGPAGPPTEPSGGTRIVRRVIELRSSRGGIALHRVPVGAIVSQGELLLELHDYHGQVREHLVSPLPKAVVLSAASSAMVPPGAYAFLLGETTP